MKHSAFSFLSVSIAALMLTACGGSDDNNTASNTEDDHDHEVSQRLLFTETNSSDLTVFELEEAVFEEVGQAAGGGGWLLPSDDGLTAALITKTAVQFVHSGLEVHDEDEADSEEEEHQEPYFISGVELSIDDADVVMTNNHYAVLNGSDTDFYIAEDLAEGTPEVEPLSIEGVTQTFPALILDEEHELYAVFDGTSVHIYEGETLENSFACANPADAIQNGALALVQCDAGILSLVLEEDESSGEASLHSATILAGVDVDVKDAQTAGDEILMYSSDAAYLVHIHDDHADAEPQSINLTGEQSLCAAALDADAEALLVVRDDKTAEVIDLTGTKAVANLTFTEATDDFSCDTLSVASGEATFIVADNSSGHLYLADSHDGAAYHIHSTVSLEAGVEVWDTALMLAKDVETHEH
jgi:hypothetical protein